MHCGRSVFRVSMIRQLSLDLNTMVEQKYANGTIQRPQNNPNRRFFRDLPIDIVRSRNAVSISISSYFDLDSANSFGHCDRFLYDTVNRTDFWTNQNKSFVELKTLILNEKKLDDLLSNCILFNNSEKYELCCENIIFTSIRSQYTECNLPNPHNTDSPYCKFFTNQYMLEPLIRLVSNVKCMKISNSLRCFFI